MAKIFLSLILCLFKSHIDISFLSIHKLIDYGKTELGSEVKLPCHFVLYTYYCFREDMLHQPFSEMFTKVS